MTHSLPPLFCSECDRYGNEEDGIELGGECVEEDCDGTIMATDPVIQNAHDHGVEVWIDLDTGLPYAEIPRDHRVLDHNRNGTYFCTLCRCVVILFDTDTHTCTLHDWKDDHV